MTEPHAGPKQNGEAVALELKDDPKTTVLLRQNPYAEGRPSRGGPSKLQLRPSQNPRISKLRATTPGVGLQRKFDDRYAELWHLTKDPKNNLQCWKRDWGRATHVWMKNNVIARVKKTVAVKETEKQNRVRGKNKKKDGKNQLKVNRTKKKLSTARPPTARPRTAQSATTEKSSSSVVTPVESPQDHAQNKEEKDKEKSQDESAAVQPEVLNQLAVVKQAATNKEDSSEGAGEKSFFAGLGLGCCFSTKQKKK